MTEQQRHATLGQTAHVIDHLTAHFLEVQHLVTVLEEAATLLRTSILVPMIQAVQDLNQVAAMLRNDGEPR